MGKNSYYGETYKALDRLGEGPSAHFDIGDRITLTGNVVHNPPSGDFNAWDGFETTDGRQLPASQLRRKGNGIHYNTLDDLAAAISTGALTLTVSRVVTRQYPERIQRMLIFEPVDI